MEHNAAYYLEQGNSHCDIEEYASASEAFTKVIELSADLDELREAHRRRALCFEFLQEKEKKLEDLNWLIEQGFGDGHIYWSRACAERKLELWEDAIRDFTVAHQMSPDIDNVLKRGQCYYQIKRYEEAIEDFTKVLQSGRNAPRYLSNAYHWRGKAYYKSNRPDEALADFNQAMKLEVGTPFSDPVAYMKTFNPEEA